MIVLMWFGDAVAAEAKVGSIGTRVERMMRKLFIELHNAYYIYKNHTE